jgi:hypothetical protein
MMGPVQLEQAMSLMAGQANSEPGSPSVVAIELAALLDGWTLNRGIS